MKTVAERISILEGLREATSVELRDGLVKSLKDKSPTVRTLAVEIIGDEELNEMLADALARLNDSDSEVRMSAIESIGKLADGKHYAKEISNYLEDKNELVRIAAAEFLGEFGDATVLDTLEMALKDKSALVRSYVAEAIGSIDQPKSVRVLEKHLSSENDETAKVGFYVGLYKLNKKDSLEKLLRLLESENYIVRCAVANSLSSLNISSAETSQVKKILKNALTKEKTVAARSSITSTLEYL